MMGFPAGSFEGGVRIGEEITTLARVSSPVDLSKQTQSREV